MRDVVPRKQRIELLREFQFPLGFFESPLPKKHVSIQTMGVSSPGRQLDCATIFFLRRDPVVIVAPVEYQACECASH